MSIKECQNIGGRPEIYLDKNKLFKTKKITIFSLFSPDTAVAGILVWPGARPPAGHQHNEEHEGGPGHEAVRGRDEVTPGGVAVDQGLASHAENRDRINC